MKKVLIYIIVGAVLYYFLKKFLKRKKYENYFKQMGFGDKYMSKFTTEELVTIHSYLQNYSKKGIILTPNISLSFYNKVKAVNDKAKSIYGVPIFTNI